MYEKRILFAEEALLMRSGAPGSTSLLFLQAFSVNFKNLGSLRVFGFSRFNLESPKSQRLFSERRPLPQR